MLFLFSSSRNSLLAVKRVRLKTVSDKCRHRATVLYIIFQNKLCTYCWPIGFRSFMFRISKIFQKPIILFFFSIKIVSRNKFRIFSQVMSLENGECWLSFSLIICYRFLSTILAVFSTFKECTQITIISLRWLKTINHRYMFFLLSVLFRLLTKLVLEIRSSKKQIKRKVKRDNN